MRDSDFVTPTDWFRWCNLEKYALDSYIARNGIILKENTVTITVGTTTAVSAGAYELDDPLAIVGVFELLDGRWRRLRSSDAVDGAGRIGDTAGQASVWRIIQATGSKLVIQFYPIPASGVYKVIKINSDPILEAPVVADPSSGEDEVNYPLGWEERIVLGMAKRALAKEESPTSHIEAQLKTVDQLIEEMAWNRLFAANQKVRNVDKVERGWSEYPLIPSRELWHFV